MRKLVFLFITGCLSLSCPAAPPSAPGNLVASAPFVSVLQLNWQDNSSNENGFEISFRQGTAGPFTVLGNAAANTSSITLTGASAGTTYQFQLRSFLNPGPEYSVYVGPATTTTPPWLLPPAPVAPTAGPALPPRTFPLGTNPPAIGFGTLFADPDVASAARLTTDLGNIDFVFFPGSAPLTVANFLGYLNRGDFTNTIFHRSVPGFIIQAGAFRADATGSAVTTLPPILNEPSISNLRGTVSMARNSVIDSATNQFFINLADNGANGVNNLDTGTFSNNGFTVFARVAGNGMSVADAIAALPTRNYSTINGAFTDTPVRGTPPDSYDPTTLVRISNVAAVSPLSYSVTSSSPTIATASLTGTNLTLSPLKSGTSTITLTATDLDNQNASSSFLLTVTDAYDQWAATKSFESAADADPSADPDKDGLINLTEFALASLPRQADTSYMLPGIDQGHLYLRFFLRSPLTGTHVTLQSAATLTGPWTDRWSSINGFTHPWITPGTSTDDGIAVTAKDPAPLNPTNRFLRLKISRP